MLDIRVLKSGVDEGSQTILFKRQSVSNGILHPAVPRSHDALICQIGHEVTENIDGFGRNRGSLLGSELELSTWFGMT